MVHALVQEEALRIRRSNESALSVCRVKEAWQAPSNRWCAHVAVRLSHADDLPLKPPNKKNSPSHHVHHSHGRLQGADCEQVIKILRLLMQRLQRLGRLCGAASAGHRWQQGGQGSSACDASCNSMLHLRHRNV
jgi:hypothetical protein